MMGDVYSYFAEKMPDNMESVDVIICLGAFVGAWRVFWWLFSWLPFFFQHCCRRKCQGKNREFKRYAVPGKSSWAVVTGGSDGIGLAMAQNLAIQGFNICIVSRNETKMQGCVE